MEAVELIKTYYSAFNKKDWEGMLAAVHDDVVHFPNQGEVRAGKSALRDFINHSAKLYDEWLTNLAVLTNEDRTRFAAEFVVNGTYIEGEPGFPPARGQKYVLPAGAFFEFRDGKIGRISNHYNLKDWIEQVS